MLTIKMMQEAAHDNSRTKGFWDADERVIQACGTFPGGTREAEKLVISRKLVLIHSEASEGTEALRDTLGFGNLAEELADVVIRCGDLAQWLGIDLETAIKAKMQKNAARPPMHGKAF